MAEARLSDPALPPESELARLARLLGGLPAGRQPTLAGTRVAGRRQGQSMDFLDFCEYRPGDDLRAVDWLASARSGSLQVRRYCGDLASDWHLCLDASSSMACAGGAKWRQARLLVAAIAYLLLDRGHRVALLLFSDAIDGRCPAGRGRGQYARIAATLAGYRLPEDGRRSDPGCIRPLVGRRDPVLLVSDFLRGDAMLPSLSALPGRDELQLIQVNDPADLQLPGDGGWLRDVESGRRLAGPAPELALPRAQRRHAGLSRALEEWCRRYRARYTACPVDQHWREVLLRHFAVA